MCLGYLEVPNKVNVHEEILKYFMVHSTLRYSFLQHNIECHLRGTDT